MKRSFILLFIAASGIAAAEPPFLEEFVKKYAPTGELAKLECRICHTQPPQRNPYGRAVDEAKKTAGRVDAALFASLEAADSDGDGTNNGDEIRAGTPPGAGNPGAAPAPAEEAPGGLIPKHAFHPVVVHFPIALFIFGAFLEILGWRKSDETQRKAGWWCLLAGALTSVAAAGLGLLSFFLNEYKWEPGPPLTHFLLAVSATILMLVTVGWRKKGPHTSTAYWALLILTTILVGVAGHFGGNLVYN